MVIPTDAIHDGFARRDAAVLKQVYKELFPSVKRFVLTNNGTGDDARDVFQDAILAAWLNVNNGKFQVTERASLHGYIAQIARHKWLDQLKSGRRRYTSRMDDRMDVPDHSDAESTAVAAAEEAGYLSELYATLGEQCRNILTLFYYEKHSLDEIGKRLSYDAATIRTMKYRCMMKLRKNHIENQEKSAHD